jgi:hypothetical protein
VPRASICIKIGIAAAFSHVVLRLLELKMRRPAAADNGCERACTAGPSRTNDSNLHDQNARSRDYVP